MPEEKGKLQIPAKVREELEHLAELEGLTINRMFAKMVQFYSDAIYALAGDGATPESLREFILRHRTEIIRKGMRQWFGELTGEDKEAQEKLRQHIETLGQGHVKGPRQFGSPGGPQITMGGDPARRRRRG
jgi:hypothetical protein